MQHDLPARIETTITFIDYVLQRQQDQFVIEQMRRNHLYAQIWGQTSPVCAVVRIVKGTISEVRDAE